jgi:hypothetical protein
VVVALSEGESIGGEILDDSSWATEKSVGGTDSNQPVNQLPLNSLFVRFLLSPISADPEDLRVSTLLLRVAKAVEDQHEITFLRRCELDFMERNEEREK